MNAFFWTIIVICVLDIIGKVYALSMRDDKRDLRLVPVDLVLMCGVLAWAIYLKP